MLASDWGPSYESRPPKSVSRAITGRAIAGSVVDAAGKPVAGATVVAGKSFDGDSISIGQPYLKGATATLEVLEHLRGPKLRIFKFKRRREYRRRRGYRDELTRLRVTAITA